MIRNTLVIESVATSDGFSVHLRGDLFSSNVPRLAEILDTLDGGGFKRVTLDFGGVRHIDSRGIGALVGWHRHFLNLGTHLELVNVPETILQPLRICNLDSILEIHPAENAASDPIRLQREALWRSYEFASQILEGLGEGLLALNLSDEIVYLNPRAEEILDCPEEEAIGKRLFDSITPVNVSESEFLQCIRTEDESVGDPRTRMHREIEFQTGDGDRVWTRIIFTPICRNGVRQGTILNLIDITDEVHARSVGIRHLGRLESLRRISEIVRTGIDYEQIMQSEMEAVLDIFDCDRAWLLHPCDPSARSWSVSIEATRPEFPGAQSRAASVEMTDDTRETLARHLASPDVQVFDSDHPFPPGSEWTQEFSVRAQMSVIIRPKTGKPWLFGIHQCSRNRVWTLNEKSLFSEIAQKIGDSLGNFLLHQVGQAKEQSLSSLVELHAVRPKGGFFSEMLEHVCRRLGVSHGFIGVSNEEGRVSTLANWRDYSLSTDFTYDLSGTPCETVIGNQVQYFPRQVWKQFPADIHLKEMGIECYLGVPLFDSLGRPLGLIAVLDRSERDQPLDSQSILEVIAARVASEIERQRAEEALKRSERENRAVLGALPDPLIRLTRSGEVLETRLPTHDRQDPLSGDLFEGDCAALREKEDVWGRIRELATEALDSQEVRSLEFEFNLLHRPRNYEARISPCSSDEAVVLIRDISERKQAEMISHAENNTLELISKDAPLEIVLDRLVREAEKAAPGMMGSILLLDPEGKRLRHGAAPNLPPEYSREVDGVEIGPNVGSCGTAAYRQEPVIVSDIESDPLWKKYKRLALMHGLRACWSAPIFGSDRRVLGTFAMYYPWPGTPDTFQIDLIHQLSQLAALAIERKQAREEKARLEDQFQQTQKLESLGILAGGIAHDFNNLLVGILGNSGLALDEAGPESPVRETLRQIEHSALRAADLTKQLLAYSGKGKFVVEPVNPQSLVEEMTHLLRLSIHTNAEFKLEFQPDTPVVEVDVTQLRQVIMNLIMNASDSLEGKAGVIRLRTGGVELKRRDLRGMIPNDVLSEGYYCFIEVSDTGSGMDRETLSKIFDPFFTTKFTGRGLGLAAVLGIVRSHQGGLKVASSPGAGTRFTLYLPSAGVARTGPQEEEVDYAGHGSGDGAHILVVDDEETVRRLANKILIRQGYTVVVAEGGVEAIEVVRKSPIPFDGILLDLTMPNMDGEQTYDELMKIQPDLRVLLTSGFSAEETFERFRGKPFAGFLQKPYRPIDLIHSMRAALQKGAVDQ